MLLLRTLAAWMLLAFLGHQVCLCSGARNKTRGADKPVNPPAGRAQRSGHEKREATGGRGKFTLKDKTQCTWGARDSGRAVKLSMKCENPEARVTGGTTAMECKYNGKPQSCPGYISNPKGFWKQVARALKRLQDKVCTDQRALVKAGMCKRAPRDAHFKLDPTSLVVSSQGGDPKTTVAPRPRHTSTTTTSISTSTSNSTSTGQDCDRHRKTAEQYCSSSWASVCSFLFSMVQTDDC
ncbi:fibroblast growth factor-binding protein 1 [Pleuronectes platessa]|uniref:fibroblast growth factor-binding protein 1 n=1 Tax=Pleuronectes platessa TaxID=8262 RepID=UPI00232A170D|nr:fibroblast growth factor-binding protein 1 [Pleuronectes platessa]